MYVTDVPVIDRMLAAEALKRLSAARGSVLSASQDMSEALTAPGIEAL